MHDRKYFEDREEKLLAPYAIKSKYSLGRVHPEAAPSNRTHFQRDRDRVKHSLAWKRLAGKTQVFVAGTGDHYRTRMTHTMEVAQIARHIARMLDLNEDLVEVLADSHDLGHPPFAHSGQVVLEKLMQPHGGFEHNAQSKRIVEFLESKSGQYPGLNLAYETLFGLMKHAGAEQIKSMIGADQFYFPLEAEVVDLADEIAYNNHDLEDGLSAGLLSLHEIKTVPLWRTNIERIQKAYPGIDDKNLRKALVSELIGTQIIQVVENSLKNIEKFNFQNPQDAKKISADKIIAFDPSEYVSIAECRKYLYQNFYFHPKVQGMNERAEQIISSLFKFYESHPEKLEFKAVPEAPFYRRLCDYIAGMTDGYAEKMYQKYCA